MEVGPFAFIGPNVVIRNSEIGDGTVIEANSHIDGAVIAGDCQVGPFARVRPGSNFARNAKVGNFVETKKAVVGEGSRPVRRDSRRDGGGGLRAALHRGRDIEHHPRGDGVAGGD